VLVIRPIHPKREGSVPSSGAVRRGGRRFPDRESLLTDTRHSSAYGSANGSANGAVRVPERGVTLVLGGGGARGLAHLGVLNALEAASIPVRAIVGNSAGAIMAASWLQHPDAQSATRHVLAFQYSQAFRRLGLSFRPTRQQERHRPSFLRRILTGWRSQVAMHLLFRRASLFHRRRLEVLIGAAVHPGRLEELRLPLWVVALDLRSGEPVVIGNGDLHTVLTAAASVAGFFPPVPYEGRLLIDSGLADNLPVLAARERIGGPIVAVNLSCDLDDRCEPGMTGIEALLRSEELASRWNNRQRAGLADVRIEPRLGSRYWLDFSNPEEIVAAGEAAARAALDAIRRLVAGTSAATPTPSPAPAQPSSPLH
jgi:NTE family protein